MLRLICSKFKKITQATTLSTKKIPEKKSGTLLSRKRFQVVT